MAETNMMHGHASRIPISSMVLQGHRPRPSAMPLSLLSEINIFRQWLVLSAILTVFIQQTEDCFLLD